MPSLQVDDVHPFYGDLMNVLYDKVRARAHNPCAPVSCRREQGSSGG